MDSTQLWTLTDGHAGNRRQAEALAGALGLGPAQDWLLQPRLPWSVSAPRNFAGAQHAFGTDFAAALEHPPRLAIGCGRQAALATRLLRACGSKAVQVLDPRIDTRHWDLVIAPGHDGLRGDNVISSMGSLNPVDDLWLARARLDSPQLATLPSPHTVLLVGGPTRHAALGDAGFLTLLRDLRARARSEGGSFSAVASRRTPARWRDAMVEDDPSLPGVRWRDERDGPNPYASLLARADRLVCTPDSVNMLSEAAATLAPVFVWSTGIASGRLRLFLDALRSSGRVRDLDDALAPFAVEPLRETMRIADEVKRRLGLDIG